MKLKVIIEPGEDSGFVAEVPVLPGCRSQGQTRAETLQNIHEAIEAWLEVEQDKVDRLVSPRDVELMEV